MAPIADHLARELLNALLDEDTASMSVDGEGDHNPLQLGSPVTTAVELSLDEELTQEFPVTTEDQAAPEITMDPHPDPGDILRQVMR